MKAPASTTDLVQLLGLSSLHRDPQGWQRCAELAYDRIAWLVAGLPLPRGWRLGYPHVYGTDLDLAAAPVDDDDEARVRPPMAVALTAKTWLGHAGDRRMLRVLVTGCTDPGQPATVELTGDDPDPDAVELAGWCDAVRDLFDSFATDRRPAELAALCAARLDVAATIELDDLRWRIDQAASLLLHARRLELQAGGRPQQAATLVALARDWAGTPAELLAAAAALDDTRASTTD